MEEITKTETQVLANRFFYCDIVSRLYAQLINFGVTIKSFDYTENADINFIFTIPGRSPLNYEELENLQNIINPNIKNHDSIRIMGYKGVYNFYVNLCK